MSVGTCGYSDRQIRQYWTEQALRHQRSSDASWSDRCVIDAEIRQILRYLQDGDTVLDAGCANGYSTLEFARQRRIDIRGRDYIPEMIEQARSRLRHDSQPIPGTVSFEVGDITALEEPDAAYDKVVVIRVVINLPNWAQQVQALRECARVLKPGGLLLLSEATLQGWQKLNQLRREWSLPDIPMPPFNRYLDQQKVIEAVAPELQLRDLVNFASTYYVGTRLLKPLLIQALGLPINVADPSMEWNRWFAQLPPWGDYGTQKLFVFEKPSIAETR
jgi:ubiquinone/menaquinone biosynthesis C-methylase UbiE